MNRPRIRLAFPALLATLWLLSSFASPPATANCQIDGPSVVRAGEDFELCGRGKNRWQFVWSGPQLSWKRGRCVEVRGLAPGTYEFTLEVSKTHKFGKRHRQVCTHRVVVTGDGGGGPLDCRIDGPSSVVEGRSFQLCGPKDHDDDDDDAPGFSSGPKDGGASWSWSGPGVPSGSRSRCVTIAGLAPGTYTFTLRRTRGAQEATCTHQVTVVANGGGTLACTIEGPSTVIEGRSFQLCGPNDTGATWSWSGPGVPSGSRSRCVTIAGRTPGTYTFTLRRTRGAQEATCTHRVTVLDAGGGVVADLCPGPIRFWLEQCRTNGSGPIGIGAQTLARVAACVDERSTAWSWSDDRNSFCALIESASLRPRDLLRQQLAILLANRCARDFDVRLPNGNRIGLDSTARFTCSPVDTGRVDALVARAESLLVRCGDPRTSPATCTAELTALTLCLGVLNRGPDTCSVGEAGSSLTLAVDESEIAMAAPRPNPFTSWTGMSFVLPRASQVEIGVYDLTGRRVRMLERGSRSAGRHELRWDGSDDGGTRVRPGVYFLRGTIGAKALGARVVYVR